MHYSVQSRDGVFVKGYRFLSFGKKYGENIGKNISKNLGGNYSQKLLDHAKQSTTDTLKTTVKRVIQFGDLIGNKIADIVAKVLRQ